MDGHQRGRAGAGWLVRLAAVSAVVMTAWDLVGRPDPVGPSARAWIWENGGPYFGIPIQNFLGWLLRPSRLPRLPGDRAAGGAAGARTDGNGRRRSSGHGRRALPVVAYGLMLASDLLSAWSLRASPSSARSSWPAAGAGGVAAVPERRGPEGRVTEPVGGWIDRVRRTRCRGCSTRRRRSAALALRDLLDRPSDDAEVVRHAPRDARRSDLIDSGRPESRRLVGEAGHGYSPSTRHRVAVIFSTARREAATRAFGRPASSPGAFAVEQRPLRGDGIGAGQAGAFGRPSLLNGNLLRALIGFGLLDDPRVARC